MDHQFTKQIQAWLNAKHESDADIIKGADMLFRLNRNRFYHSVPPDSHRFIAPTSSMS